MAWGRKKLCDADQSLWTGFWYLYLLVHVFLSVLVQQDINSCHLCCFCHGWGCSAMPHSPVMDGNSLQLWIKMKHPSLQLLLSSILSQQHVGNSSRSRHLLRNSQIVSIICACVAGVHMHACSCPQRPEEDIGYPWNQCYRWLWTPWCRCSEANSGLLQEQLSTTQLFIPSFSWFSYDNISFSF